MKIMFKLYTEMNFIERFDYGIMRTILIQNLSCVYTKYVTKQHKQQKNRTVKKRYCISATVNVDGLHKTAQVPTLRIIFIKTYQVNTHIIEIQMKTAVFDGFT